MESEPNGIGNNISSCNSKTRPHKMSMQNEVLSAEMSKAFIFNLEDIVSKELKNTRVNSGPKTREKIFIEIHALLLKWDQGEPGTCQSCCEFSTADNSDSSYKPTTEELFQILTDVGLKSHSCTNTDGLAWHLTSDISKHYSDAFRMVINLFTCYVDGYGVETNIDAGLNWLMKAAQRGSIMCQSYGPVLYFRKHRQLTPYVPSVKWLVIAFVVYGSRTAREVLQVTHPKILLVAENTRSMMMGTGFSLDEWQVGLEMQNWTSPQINIILKELAASRSFIWPKGIWTKIKNLFQNNLAEIFPWNFQPYRPMIISISLNEVLEGNDYLHAAASNWSQPYEFCSKYLDLFPADINILNHLGESPLLAACRAGKLQMVTLLIERGGDVTIPAGLNGETPLHWLALLHNSQTQIEAVLKKGADINSSITEPRFYRGRFPGPPTNPRDGLLPGIPLDWAIQASNEPVVQFLLDHGADPLFGYQRGYSPIEKAVILRDTVMLQLCVNAIREPPKDLNLFQAYFTNVSATRRLILGISEENEIGIIKIILSCLPKLSSAGDIDVQIYVPLQMAVQSLSLGMITCILDKMEEKTRQLNEGGGKDGGYDLVDVAIKRNEIPIVKFLIQRAYARGYHTLDNWIPYNAFDLTSGPDNPELLNILLRNGVTLNARDKSGLLPIHSAILHGNFKVADELIAAMTEEEFELKLGRNSFMGFPGASPGNMMTFFGFMISHRQDYRPDLKSFEWLFTLHPSATEFFNITTINQTTALHLAVEELPLAQNAFAHLSQRPILELLLSKFKGPDHFNAKYYENNIPLHLAALIGNYECFELLVTARADINAEGPQGTPLDVIFEPPPPHFRTIRGGPTQEIVRGFVEGRNRIADMLRKKGGKGVEELRSESSKKALAHGLPIISAWEHLG